MRRPSLSWLPLRSAAHTRLLTAGGVLAAVCAAALLVVLGGACGGSTASSSSPLPSPSGKVVLTLVGEKGEKRFTMNQLEALPSYTGYGGIKSSTGTITLPSKFTGVKLSYLTGLVGGISKSTGVTIVGSDGYGMTFAYDQIMNQGFTAYDPATGTEQTPKKDLTVIIAYRHDGKLMGADEGPLRLIVAEPTSGGQVVDGHWSVKWIDRISVTKASALWDVQVQGAQSAHIDKPSYVNCASPGCHGSGWVDAKGQRWEGVPLYLVTGMVDGGKKHGPGAYNMALAKKGYAIQIETADGKVVTIDSRKIAGNTSIVLAGKLDGGELPDAYFPLRLVGPGLSEAQMPGQIQRIVVRVK